MCEVPLRGGDVLHLEDDLRLEFVHRDLRGLDARTRVGDLAGIECGLHAAVFAPATVERDVHGIHPRGELVEIFLGEIDRDDLILAQRRESLGDIRAGVERNLAFARLSTHQNSNLFHYPYYTIYWCLGFLI